MDAGWTAESVGLKVQCHGLVSSEDESHSDHLQSADEKDETLEPTWADLALQLPAPLTALITKYAAVWVDMDLLHFVLALADYNTRHHQQTVYEYGLDVEGLSHRVESYELDFLVERGYLQPSQLHDADTAEIARVIRALAHEQPVASSDVHKVILVYRIESGDVDDCQTVVLDAPLNGAYFTARDFVCGLGSFVERWQCLVMSITNFYYDRYAQGHPIHVKTLTVMEYMDGVVTLQCDICGMYEN